MVIVVPMIGFLVRTAIVLLANAIGLIVASLVLDGIAVVSFTVISALMLPFLASQLRRRGSSALGGVALLATLSN